VHPRCAVDAGATEDLPDQAHEFGVGAVDGWVGAAARRRALPGRPGAGRTRSWSGSSRSPPRSTRTSSPSPVVIPGEEAAAFPACACPCRPPIANVSCRGRCL